MQEPAAPGAAPEFSIDREGVWRHRGEPIRRESLLRLFASMLRRDGAGRYLLESPGQRVAVEVADAPFLATESRLDAEHDPPRLWLTTSTGRCTVVDRAHPLLLRPDAVRGEQRLYHRVDAGLEALVHRNLYYRLAELAVAEPGSGRLGIRSDGVFFALE